MTRRSSCGCVWQRTDPDSFDGECAVGDTCECDDPDHHPCGCGRVPEQCDECQQGQFWDGTPPLAGDDTDGK